MTTITMNWEMLGAEFANMSDEEQAKFFKGMACELTHWKSDHHKQMQAAMVADHLTDDNKKQLETFLGMLWFKETP